MGRMDSQVVLVSLIIMKKENVCFAEIDKNWLANQAFYFSEYPLTRFSPISYDI